MVAVQEKSLFPTWQKHTLEVGGKLDGRQTTKRREGVETNAIRLDFGEILWDARQKQYARIVPA